MDDLLVDINLDRAEICWETALRRVSGANLHSTSGCREWTNEQLINHLIGGGLRYEKLLAQCSPAEVEATRGQNHLGDDRLEAFWSQERAFRRLVGECDLGAQVSHRIGRITGHQLVRMRILELALHAADLSAGTGDKWPIDDELAEYISTHLGELIADLGSAGGYAAPRPEPGAGASHAQRVLNVSGR
ncbi:maleylpyruvate isomerase N-terminal domain-containing protein [Brevibacterium sp. UCMA 11752]|uniref:maleylpyruvate isomerase N-terminal domain-containing protein n=1 Tax=Brevibacterium sp. UCMA 11752 TaxID=2745946 RepID=UPI001F46E2A1|nr:maleylpyruvate isomerase N-terminal domain-containing protein [Brevibacterium sp. UCMA 11752]MCF2588149.1 maleylpyruvate isomerase N-terminal domain-containing protein [Brevibacterium sp. UCMA 11752]